MDIFEEIVAARKGNQPVVLATVIESRGSAPREEGARMLVRSDGTIAGTVGGGAIEKIIIDEAMKLMAGGTARLISHDLKDIGMTCGGGMSVFIEPLVPAAQLVIFGAGHIGACLAQIGKMLEFNVTVVDSRPEFANAERLPWADTVIAEEYATAIDKVTFNERTYAVILTHKHIHDFEVLEKCLTKRIPLSGHDRQQGKSCQGASAIAGQWRGRGDHCADPLPRGHKDRRKYAG